MSSRERTMLIVLGVVAVAAAAFFFLTRGGDEGEQAAPTPPVSPPQVVSPVEQLPKPPRTPAFFGGRDPFVPLVIAEVGGGTTDGTDGGITDGGPTGGPGGGPSGGPGGGPVGGPGGGGQEPGVSVGGHHVVVIDVFVQDGKDVVQVEVDGEVFVVGEGDTFAQNFQVVSIDGQCATFLFGDESFQACEGGRPK